VTEAALVMIPLVAFLMIMPAITLIWTSEQYVRTEAHRDMFDKTTSFVQLPRGDKLIYGTPIMERQRRRAYPLFPPEIASLSGDPNSIIKAPGSKTVQFPFNKVDLFPEGFPNYYAEGWQYRKFKYAGGWWAGEMELMRYGAVIRTPWTWLGWPSVPTQDAYYEPLQIQGWYDANTVGKIVVGRSGASVKKRLKLID